MDVVKVIEIFFAVVIIMSIGLLMIKRKSNESVSLIWIVVAILAVFQAAFPQLLDTVCLWLGIEYPPILALMFLVIGLTVIMFYLSSEVAVAQSQTRELAMHISLLNKEVAELKRHIYGDYSKLDDDSACDANDLEIDEYEMSGVEESTGSIEENKGG